MKIVVKVVPSAKQNALQKDMDGNFKIWLKVPPKEGKANLALIKYLSEYFNKPKTEIRIINGHLSKKKIIEIDD